MSFENKTDNSWAWFVGWIVFFCIIGGIYEWWTKIPEPKVKYNMTYQQMRIFEGLAGVQDVKQYLREFIYPLEVISDNFELSPFCKDLIYNGYGELCEWISLPYDKRSAYLNSLPPTSSGHMLIKVMFYEKELGRAVAEIRCECYRIALYNITVRRESAKKIDEILSKYEIAKDRS